MSAVTAGGFTGYSAPVRSEVRQSDPAGEQLRPERLRRERRRREQRRRSHLRMTGRGRTVLLGLVATPVVIVALAFGINAGGAAAGSSSTPLATITVVGGENLWGVAKQIAPNADPRDVIADIVSVNRLNSADIFPGQQLAVPAKYEIAVQHGH